MPGVCASVTSRAADMMDGLLSLVSSRDVLTLSLSLCTSGQTPVTDEPLVCGRKHSTKSFQEIGMVSAEWEMEEGGETNKPFCCLNPEDAGEDSEGSEWLAVGSGCRLSVGWW